MNQPCGGGGVCATDDDKDEIVTLLIVDGVAITPFHAPIYLNPGQGWKQFILPAFL